MAEYSGRRGADGTATAKRGSRLISRNFTKSSDQNIQLCNRIGCSGRFSSARSTQNVSLDKTRVLKPSSSCSTPGNEMTATPSKVVSKVSNSEKPLRTLKNSSSSVPVSFAGCGDSSSSMQEAEVATSNPVSPAWVDQTESLSGESSLLETSSPSENPSIRPKRAFLRKPASVVGTNLTSSRGSGGSKSTPQLSRSNTSTTRPSSVYFNCNSIPVAAASDSARSYRKQMLKKRSSEGESSSSSRAKQPTMAENTRIPSLQNGISISETREARRSQTSLMNNVSTSVRARGSDSLTSHRPSLMLQRESPIDQRMHRLPYSLPAAGRLGRANNFARPNVASSSSLMDHEGFRHFNIDGITEVLLALDRIELDEEISFEQLLALESNVFLNGLSFLDQHRDMRLDIDSMSYEELLALEERMGSVSTALSEEALQESINKSVYKPISVNFSVINGDQDDTKCSICQEEYNIGDEIGRLKCKHCYHVECIHHWLRQKNWCPICKSSAASSSA